MRDDSIPLFFKDESKIIDHEIMLDYFIAWTLRCATEKNKNEKIRNVSRKILNKILNKIIPGNIDDYFVEEVRTWKQWERIDLCAEIVLKHKSDKELVKKYAILFENKMYTHLSEGQLKKYKEKFDGFYNDNKYEKIYIFLTCHSEKCKYENDFDEAEKKGFTPMKFDDLRKDIDPSERTGNFMFDEFWFEF